MSAERRTVRECRAVLRNADPVRLGRLIEELSDDTRAGVQDAVASARRRLDIHAAELDRLRGMGETERAFRARGLTIVAGVDEVGRGAIAGPVTAAAVVLPDHALIEQLDDSKRLDPERREIVARRIRASAVAWHVTHVAASDIDRIGIVGATMRAMRDSLEGLGVTVEHALVDGDRGPDGVECTCIVGGDAKVAAIAAASVLAKVARDRLMSTLDTAHPGYALGANKGYCTDEHIAAVRARGPSPVHRQSFSPCADEPRLF
jgi:ribonuclease HII